AQLEALHQLAAERAAATFGKERVFGVQLDAGLVGRLRLAVAANSHVAGRHALDAAVLMVEDLGGSEARIDFDAQFGRLLCKPAAEISEAADIVALVAHGRQD